MTEGLRERVACAYGVQRWAAPATSLPASWDVPQELARLEAAADGLDRLSLGLSLATSRPVPIAPVVLFQVWGWNVTVRELLVNATWSPTPLDRTGVVVQIAGRLVTGWELRARLLVGGLDYDVSSFWLVDCRGGPFTVTTGKNVVLV